MSEVKESQSEEVNVRQVVPSIKASDQAKSERRSSEDLHDSKADKSSSGRSKEHKPKREKEQHVKLSPEEARDLGEMLKKWKEEGGVPTLTNVFRRVMIGIFGREAYNQFMPAYKAFMKTVGALTDLPRQTIELIKSAVKRVKKMEAMFSKCKEKETKGQPPKKEKEVKPQPLVKKPFLQSLAKVQIPKNYGNALSFTRKQTLHNLYKSFIHNLSQQHKKHPSLLDYISKVESHLFEKARGDPTTQSKIANPIIKQLATDRVITAKIRMLEGKTPPADVAADKSSAFMSDEDIKRYDEVSKKELEYMNVDFYMVNLKKAVGAEFCRYCKKESSAFCEYQKQTRRSDEPMTRFMRCNSCMRTWRD